MAQILVSAEVREEIEEILWMLDEVAPGAHVLVLAPSECLDGTVAEGPRLAVRPAVAAPYGRVMAKVVSLLHFLYVVLRTRPVVVISGWSMLKHRLGSRVFRYEHVAYHRGLYFEPGTRSGFADRLRYGLPFLRDAALVNSMESDRVLTVSPLNLRYFEARGVDPAKVAVVGAVGLHNLAPRPPGIPRTFVLTSALAAHGHLDEHVAQVEALATLAAAAQEPFVLRVHPRDGHDYAGDPRFAGVVLDRLPARDFLASLTPADLLVSPLSTLAFEASYVGARVRLYRLPGVTLISERAVREAGLHPSDLSPALLENPGENDWDGASTMPNVLAPVDLAPVAEVLRGRVTTAGGAR